MASETSCSNSPVPATVEQVTMVLLQAVLVCGQCLLRFVLIMQIVHSLFPPGSSGVGLHKRVKQRVSCIALSVCGMKSPVQDSQLVLCDASNNSSARHIECCTDCSLESRQWSLSRISRPCCGMILPDKTASYSRMDTSSWLSGSKAFCPGCKPVLVIRQTRKWSNPTVCVAGRRQLPA